MTAAECIPSHQWLVEFLTDFAALRGQLHREEEDMDPFLPKPPAPPPPHPLPHFRDKNGWQRYCIGVVSPHPHSSPQALQDAEHSTETSDPNSHVSAEAPGAAQQSTSQVPGSAPASAQSAADTDMTSSVGHPPQMAVLASLDQVIINYLLQWHVNWAVAGPDITDLSMRWLYALMAQVEKPIALESSSQLSKLLRHCIKVRTQISDTNDIRLLALHMLIALTGAYFGQDGTLAACMQPGWS